MQSVSKKDKVWQSATLLLSIALCAFILMKIVEKDVRKYPLVDVGLVAVALVVVL